MSSTCAHRRIVARLARTVTPHAQTRHRTQTGASERERHGRSCVQPNLACAWNALRVLTVNVCLFMRERGRGRERVHAGALACTCACLRVCLRARARAAARTRLREPVQKCA
eukprot:3391853-Pleurochrysis_carterae.AAC.1